MNENAKWQDGEPVTADDVVFTMQVYNSPSAAVVRQNNAATLGMVNQVKHLVKVEEI